MFSCTSLIPVYISLYEPYIRHIASHEFDLDLPDDLSQGLNILQTPKRILHFSDVLHFFSLFFFILAMYSLKSRCHGDFCMTPAVRGQTALERVQTFFLR